MPARRGAVEPAFADPRRRRWRLIADRRELATPDGADMEARRPALDGRRLERIQEKWELLFRPECATKQ